MASNSSAGDEDFFDLAPRPRYCASDGCRARLASPSLDPHSFCVQCRGIDCDIGRRCVVCTDWDEPTMAAYLSHQVKLKKKREAEKKRESGKAKVKKPVSQSAGDPPLPLEEELAARDARLEERLQRSMEELFERRQRDLMASVVSEIKDALSLPTKTTGPSQNEEPVPEGPPENLEWMNDSRYVGAKPLFDSGLITDSAFNNIILVCKADAGIDVPVVNNAGNSGNVDNVDPPGPPPKKPKLGDPDDVIDPDLESIAPEPDFGDLVTCIISFLPHAKEDEIFEKANEFLVGAAASSNVRQFVRLKLYKEIDNSRKVCNEKVKKLTFGQGNKSVGGGLA